MADPAKPSTGLRRTAFNIGLLGLSQLAVTIAAFGTQVLLARGLSQGEFGSFMTVLAMISLTAPLAVFGVSELWLQRFGREGVRAFRWVAPSIRLVVGASAMVVAGMLLWSAAYWFNPIEARLRLLLAPIVVAQAFVALAMSVLQLRGSYGTLAALQFAPHMGRIAVVTLAWGAGLSVVDTALGYGLVALATVAVSVMVLRPFWRRQTTLEGHHPDARSPFAGRTPQTSHLLAGATPFLLGSLFYLIGMYLGTVVAGEFLGAEAAAILAVPMSIIMAVYLVPRVIYQQYFLAKLHRWARSDREAILVAYRLGTTAMVLLGCMTALLIAGCGWIAIPLLFGPEYQASVPVLAVLSFAIPLRFGAASVASLLTSGSQLRRKVAYQGGGAVVFVIALAVATPLFGLFGAAAATVLAEAALMMLFWSAVRKYVVADAQLPTWEEVRRRLRGGTTHASGS